MVATIALFISFLSLIVESRIGLVIPNNFESYQLVCPENSFFPCAASDGEFVQTNQFDLANHRFYEGYIGCPEAKVAITTSGLATVNAALTTQLLIDQYRDSKDPIDFIITYGIAGGMDDRLNVGDVLVASKWAIYNLWVWQDEDDDVNQPLPLEEFGDYDRDLGYFESTEYGRIWFQKQELFLEPEVRSRVEFFESDPDSIAIMSSIANDVESNLLSCSEDQNGDEICLPQAPKLYVEIDGDEVIGLTADIFVDNTAIRTRLFEQYSAQSIDMETGSVAMVAATNEIPFIAFRSLSDLAGGEDEANSVDTFFAFAVENSITVLTSFIDAKFCQLDDGKGKKSKDGKDKKTKNKGSNSNSSAQQGEQLFDRVNGLQSATESSEATLMMYEMMVVSILLLGNMICLGFYNCKGHPKNYKMVSMPSDVENV